MKNLKPITEPMILSSTFIQKIPCQEGYSRVDNPTRLALEKRLAILEKAHFALAFSSGSAAIMTILASLQAGDHIICHEEIYEGTLRLLQNVFQKFGIVVDLVNLSNQLILQEKINSKTKIIWFENVTNPTLQVLDTKKICRFGKQKRIITVVDNTFCTPIFQNPLCLGADIVVHSLTKFINGHHDAMGGAIMLNNKAIFSEFKFLQHTIGAVPSPFDCFLIERGLETLLIRMKAITQSAKVISQFLRPHPKIIKINHPDFSGLISFWVNSETDSKKLVQKFRRIKIAHSLGGTVTTVMHPGSMMSLSLPKKRLNQLGITDNLIRMSVGLENPTDIIRDLKRALG